MNPPELFEVPVRGGALTVARWGRGGPVVLAPHGVTANHVSWTLVAAELGDDVTLLAPDLRGRGASAGLPGPWGMAAHADDLLAVLDHLEVREAVVAGHSMGGFVAVKAAARYPDRITALVLLDGGIRLPVPPGLDVDEVLLAVIGPAMERLSRTFDSREAYRDHWRAHPAVGPHWNLALEAYVDYDVHEVDGAWVSRVELEAIRADGRDTLIDESLTTDLPQLRQRVHFVWAPRGILDADPLYPAEVVDHVAATTAITVHRLTDVNHYTMMLTADGARAVAEQIRSALGA
jgi:pimeloyl-ACP methyl ester carboxylesterase